MSAQIRRAHPTFIAVLQPTPSTKSLPLRLFGAARALVGRPTVDITLPANPCTVAELHTHVVARFPDIATLGNVRYAVNQAFAKTTDPVSAHDEVALLPPVSGG